MKTHFQRVEEVVDKCEIIPPDQRKAVFEVRVYNGHPDHGGKLKKIISPELTVADKWTKSLRARMPENRVDKCLDCGIDISSELCGKKLRCDKCGRERSLRLKKANGRARYARMKREREAKKDG